MFVWINLLGVADSFKLITDRAVEEKVLLVPGVAFDPANAKRFASVGDDRTLRIFEAK